MNVCTMYNMYMLLFDFWENDVKSSYFLSFLDAYANPGAEEEQRLSPRQRTGTPPKRQHQRVNQYKIFQKTFSHRLMFLIGDLKNQTSSPTNDLLPYRTYGKTVKVICRVSLLPHN